MFLRPIDPALYQHNVTNPSPDLTLKYLGTAGFVIEGASHTLVVDPFVTRPGFLKTMFQKIPADDVLVERILPHADDVLIGHAHHDHILDAPSLCKRTGARLIGSRSACQVGRAAGLPEEQLVETMGREWIQSGPGRCRGLPSRHGRIYFGIIPLQGEITEPPAWPTHYRHLRHGLVLNWHIELAELSVVHIDSADFIEEELEGIQADVVCLCAIGRQYRPDYVKTAVSMLKPRFVIACHWDWFFSPYNKHPRCLPGVDLPGFVREIQEAGACPIVLPFDGVLGVSAQGNGGQG